MRKLSNNRGFTLIELVVVLTLIGIIGIPIIRSIISASQSNFESKLKVDATVLSNKLVEGISSNEENNTISTYLTNEGLVLGDDQINEKEYNNRTYFVKCTKVDAQSSDTVNTGSYSLPGYTKYFLLDFTSNSVTAKSIENGAETNWSGVTLPSNPLSNAGNNCSIVVNNQNIIIYPYDKLDAPKNGNADISLSTCASVSTGALKTNDDLVAAPSGVTIKNSIDIRIKNSTGSPINIKFYNNAFELSGTTRIYRMLNIFYRNNDFITNIGFDKSNVTLHDLTNTTNSTMGNTVTFENKMRKVTYKVAVYKKKDGVNGVDKLAEREVTVVAKTNP